MNRIFTIIITVLLFTQIAMVFDLTSKDRGEISETADIRRPSPSRDRDGNREGIVARFHMDEGTGTDVKDTSGNGLHGTLEVGGGDNANSKWVEGVKGKAVKLDGTDDHIDVDVMDTVFRNKCRDSNSVFMWIRPDMDLKQGAQGETQTFFYQYSRYGMNYILPDGILKVRVTQDEQWGRASGCDKVEIEHPVTLEAGTWYNIGFTFLKNDCVRLYIDGKEVASAATVDKPVSGYSDTYRIGMASGANNWKYLNGAVDEFSMYDRVLSDDEIRRMYGDILHVEQDEFGGSWFDDFEDESGIEGELGARPLEADEHTVGLWHFDEGSGKEAKDESGNGNHGTLTNMEEVDWVEGRFGKGLEFDGVDDHVNCGNDVSVKITSGTLEAWFKTPNAGSSGRGIVTKPHAFGMFLENNNFAIGNWGGTPTIISTGIYLADNQWHHVASTFQSGIPSGTMLYVDGIHVLTTTMTISAQTWGFFIGNDGNTQHFSGIIDEVRISNITRSPEEIVRNYQSGLVLRNGKVEFARNEFEPGAGCVGYWSFDEGSGDIAYDRSGNGNDGTLMNMNNNDWVDGVKGKGLEFDGADDYVEVGDNPSLEPSGSFSISFWFKTTQLGNKVLIEKNNNNVGYSIQRGGTNILVMDVGSGSGIWTKGNSYHDGSWHHVVFIYKGVNDGSVYVDDVDDTDITAPGTPSYGTDSLIIGSRGGNYAFSGLIDEIAIYNRALTSYEIGQHYNHTIHPTNATLTSTPISLPDTMLYSTLSLTKTEPANTYINVSVLNAETNTTIPGFDNLTSRTIDLTPLNELGITSIRLRAYFSGNGSATPSLDSWGVEWTAENAWRDSFTGDSKLAYPYGVDEHTVGYWRFEEGSGDVTGDSSGNGNDGTLHNMEDGDWVEGVHGRGLNFDGGNEYVDCGGNYLFSSFSVEMWCKISDLDTYQTLLSYYINNNNGFWIAYNYMGTTSNQIRFNVGKSISEYDCIYSDPVVTNTSNYYHLVVIFDNTTKYAAIYIDGELSAEKVLSHPYHTPQDHMYIGASKPYSTFFNGIIDEVRISNIARSPEEICQAYQAGIAIHGGQAQLADNEIIPDGNTSALWHFNEDDGNVLHDSSGNGNDGVIHGANWTKGIMSGALEYDGVDDYVDTNNANIDDFFSTSITLEAWIKTSMKSMGCLINIHT